MLTSFRAASAYNTKDNRREDQQRTALKGVLLNNYIRTEADECIVTTVPVPEDPGMPDELKNKTNDKIEQKNYLKKIFPLIIAPVAMLGGAALFTKLCKKSLKFDKDVKLPDIARNVNLSDERDFVTYAALQNPTKKTIIGALSVFAFSGSILIMKNFVDGFKDIWVKRQESSIHKNLQERLIDVETRSFSGKNQIVKSMLAQKAAEMDEIIKQASENHTENNTFTSKTKFKGKDKEDQQKSVSSEILPIIAGIATLGVSIFLASKSMKNIREMGNSIEKQKDKYIKNIEKQVKEVSQENLPVAKDNLIKLFTISESKQHDIRKTLNNTAFKEEDIKEICNSVKENLNVYTDAPEYYGKKNKISFYSYVDDVRGHLYNAIVSPSKLSTALFLCLTGETAISYIGNKTVEAIKDVQVKKTNADTEYNLHDKLVQVELNNFLTKKNSVVDPMMKDFKEYVAKNPNNKDEIAKRYNAVLEEIKHGPPFIYS